MRIAITVSGGNVQAVFANEPGVTAVLVDWDNVAAGDEPDAAQLGVLEPGTDRINRSLFPYEVEY